MSSIWQMDAIHTQRDPLRKDKKCEIAVIGGGLTGILTATLLAEEGKRVVVIEADTVGSGQTGHTTAKVTSQHGAIYHKLENTFGLSTAAAYAEANGLGVRVVYDYDSATKTDLISFDIIYGIAALEPKLICALKG